MPTDALLAPCPGCCGWHTAATACSYLSRQDVPGCCWHGILIYLPPRPPARRRTERVPPLRASCAAKLARVLVSSQLSRHGLFAHSTILQHRPVNPALLPHFHYCSLLHLAIVDRRRTSPAAGLNTVCVAFSTKCTDSVPYLWSVPTSRSRRA